MSILYIIASFFLYIILIILFYMCVYAGACMYVCVYIYIHCQESTLKCTRGWVNVIVVINRVTKQRNERIKE